MSRDNLAALERLQTIDLEIEGLRKSASEVPARLAEFEAAVAEARSAADVERGRLADRERARSKVEQSLVDDRERVKKWEERLPSLKHPREFAALKREVDGLHRMIEDNEELVARARGEEGEIKESLKSLEATLASRESTLASETKTLKGQESETQGRINELQEARQEAAKKVDARLLATYNNVLRRRPGSALVEAQNGSCMGCHRRLQAQMYNRLLAGDVDQCPACGRLVYVATKLD